MMFRLILVLGALAGAAHYMTPSQVADASKQAKSALVQTVDAAQQSVELIRQASGKAEKSQ